MSRDISLAMALLALAGGCATPLGVAMVKLSPERPLDDQSALAPDLAQKHYQRLIVVPPGEHKEGELLPLARLAAESIRGKSKKAPPPPPEWPAPAVAAAEVERGLLKAGLGLVSPDVAGRAAATAKHASKAERLLALGKETGADAILELVAFEWRPEAYGRWFVYEEERNAFDEVDRLKYETTDGRRWRFHGTQLELTARLLDAQTGTLEGEFRVSCNLLWNLPAPYEETLNVYEHALTFHKANYHLSSEEEAGRRACVARVTERIAAALAAQPVRQ